jgi:hypothetical protein
MKLLLPPVQLFRRARGGWALMIVMVLAVGALLVVGSVLSWSNVTSNVTSRNNEFYATTYAAEAATEKVLSAVVCDYENYGAPVVYSKLTTYSNFIPSASDDPYWTNYTFTAGPGQTNAVVVNLINPTNIVVLGPPYQGLIMNAATYEIISTAMNNTTDFHIGAAVGQQINLGSIPIFQFAIFFQNTMEIDPGANMTINGFTHGNSSIYLDPNSGVSLTFSNDVSGSGSIVLGENPLDPTSGRNANPNPLFDGYHLSGVNPLILPVGTNTAGTATNISQNVNAILQVPPAGTSPNSQTGSNYLYNKADLIVLISNNSVTVTSGVQLNSQATVISNAEWSLWLNTNASTRFYDQRQGITIQTADIDVGKLTAWSATNNTLRPAIIAAGRSGNLDSLYIADLRANSNAVVTTNYNYTTNLVFTNTAAHPAAGSTNVIPPITTNTTLTQSTIHPANGTYMGSVSTNFLVSPKVYQYSLITGYSYEWILGVTTTPYYTTNYNVVSQAGVVLTNGSTLPPQGLGVATPDPVFIVGNYNVSTNGTPANLGTFNTSKTYPAAVYSDAITILSSNWNPLNSSNSIASRTATSDTVNAAFLTGNVPSNGSYYSGGVENFPRFLEDWGNCTFTYNGSMVCMFNSQVATAPWPGTGTVYNPPTRNWAFDLNFNNALKQPPLTPHVIAVNRAAWTFLQTNTVSF